VFVSASVFDVAVAVAVAVDVAVDISLIFLPASSILTPAGISAFALLDVLVSDMFVNVKECKSKLKKG